MRYAVVFRYLPDNTTMRAERECESIEECRALFNQALAIASIDQVSPADVEIVEIFPVPAAPHATRKFVWKRN
jgi:hypothetical protein